VLVCVKFFIEMQPFTDKIIQCNKPGVLNMQSAICMHPYEDIVCSPQQLSWSGPHI